MGALLIPECRRIYQRHWKYAKKHGADTKGLCAMVCCLYTAGESDIDGIMCREVGRRIRAAQSKDITRQTPTAVMISTTPDTDP